jgi:hypothetical protein
MPVANSGFAQLLFLCLQECAFFPTSFRPAERIQFEFPQLSQKPEDVGALTITNDQKYACPPVGASIF